MWKPAGVCALSWANESSLRCEASLLLLPSDIPDLGHQCKRGHWQLAAKPGCVMEVTPFRMGHAQGCIASRRHPSIPQAKFFYLQGFNLILPYRKRKVLLLGPPRRWSDSQIPAVAGGKEEQSGDQLPEAFPHPQQSEGRRRPWQLHHEHRCSQALQVQVSSWMVLAWQRISGAASHLHHPFPKRSCFAVVVVVVFPRWKFQKFELSGWLCQQTGGLLRGSEEIINIHRGSHCDDWGMLSVLCVCAFEKVIGTSPLCYGAQGVCLILKSR